MRDEEPKNRLLPLHTGILYGPINSRRYGRSLGINLFPGSQKVCSFNCVYCHYGLTRDATIDAHEFETNLPEVREVARTLEDTLKTDLACDLITFSGNGEPTLHPQFPEIVSEVVRLRDRYRPGTPVALLSNATGLARERVRQSLADIDLPVFKLDGGTEPLFRAINRPHAQITLDMVVGWIGQTQNPCLQTVLVDGAPANTGAADLAAYCGQVAAIAPREVHLYSIDRPVPNTDIRLVPADRLKAIAATIETETGIPVRAFHL
jgi:wyosine [tRNA(Phe)-imidazoG37] synthetase (radical SAM superfamily)